MDNNELLKKYYPKTLDDIFSQDITIEILKNMIKNNKLHNMIFYGEYGTGKTTTINKFIEEFFGDKCKLFTLRLCVTDNRGVEAIRTKIIPFVQTNHLFSKKNKLIIIDDFDLMKSDAQNLLKFIIDTYSNNCKICIICNNINKINNCLQIRCIKLKFNKNKKNDIFKKIEFICIKENIKYTKSSILLLTDYYSDYRKILNIIYFTNIIENNITIPICKKYNNIITREEIIKNIKNKSINEIIKYIYNLSLINNFDNIIFLNKIFELYPLLKNKNYNVIDFINDLQYISNTYTKIFDDHIIYCQFALILHKVSLCL